MAFDNDDERLFVTLEARVADFERKMAAAERRGADTYNGLQRNSRRATAAMEADMARATGSINRALATTSGQIGKFGRAQAGAFVGALGGALAIREISRLADTWSDLKARVENATGSIEEGEAVLGRLTAMARRTYSGLEATAESWLRNATALRELGMSSEESLDFVEALNNALVVGAIKGERAASVQNALSKAMSLGKLAGDELNTILASGGKVAELLAAELGVNTTELRKLGTEGKITGAVIRNALVGNLERLREEADAMPATLSDAFQILRDAVLAYVGGADQAAGVSSRLAEAVITVADNFDKVGDAAVKLGFVIGTALIGRALGGILAVIPSAVAAVGTMTAAMSAGTGVAAAFSATLGPIGLAAGAAAAALYLLHDSQTDAEKAADTHEAALRVLEAEIRNVDYANGDAVASTRQKIAADIEAAKVALARAKAERELAAAITRDLVDPGMSLLPAPTPSAGDVDAIVEGNPLVRERQALIDTIEKQIDDLAAAQADFEDYASGRKEPPRVAPAARAEVDPPASPPPTRARSGRGGGSGGRGRKDALEREIQQIQQRTAALQAATAAQAALDPLVEDYGRAAEKAAAAHELLTAAQQAGVALTPELRQQIDVLADSYAQATADAKRLDEAQAGVVKRAEDIAALKQDVVGGIVRGLRDGKDAADIFADALGKISDHLLDLSLQQIFKPGASGGGGFLSTIMGGIFGTGFATGGYTGAGRKDDPAGVVHRGEYVFSKAAVDRLGLDRLEAAHRAAQRGTMAPVLEPDLRGFAAGGYTGPGGKFTPAGVVHAGEFVFSKAAVGRLGVDRLDAMHRAAKRGYAEGGEVTAPPPATSAQRPETPVVNTKVVNVIDPSDMLEAALKTKAGERVFLNFVSRNRRAIGSQLG